MFHELVAIRMAIYRKTSQNNIYERNSAVENKFLQTLLFPRFTDS